MHGGPELTVALLASVALVAGAAIRLLSRKARFPFTVAMLLLGIGAGLLASRLSAHESIFLEVLHAGADISPQLIILIFLPALIFESSYSIDVHSFRKDVGSVVLLALPALVVTTGLVATVMYFLTGSMGWGWGWGGALVFGALISATDPVAVVAVLREVGAPRRLAILIEGESLFNDGTAIVVFSVLLAMLTGESGGELDAGAVGLRFLWVVTGGMGVGLVLAYVASSWIGRTFNDPMVEITLTLALAYAAMVVGEGLLHVSGVMAVVIAGLWMSGPGRTRISPEVLHFLHRFWEMLAYVANTLIFFLVGLVIAVHVDRAPAGVVLTILAAWAAIVVIRFGVTMAFRPLMGLVGERVSTAEGLVMSWGGLRGAVSLALALAVSRHPDVETSMGNQILVVTAGVVLLTILINGTTTGWVLNRLGLTKVDPADRLANLSIESGVLEDVGSRLEDVARSRDLRGLPWADVRLGLHTRREELEARIEALESELESQGQERRAIGYWRKALEIEHHAYWRAFGKGTLGASATEILAHEVALHVDRLSKGETRAPDSRVPERTGVRERLARTMRGMAVDIGGLRFSRLSLLYDLCRGQALAAERVLHDLAGDAEAIDPIVEIYRGWLRAARERIEDMRTNLPEVTRAIEQRLARRIELNFERDAYEERVEEGVLDGRVAKAALADIEERMKSLRQGRTRVALPETADLCRDAELFQGLSEATRKQLADITKEEVFAPGEVLCEEGTPGNSTFVVARGAVHVVKKVDDREVIVDILGGGDIVGEMALLSGEPRTATIVAATTTTVGEIHRKDFDELLDAEPDMRERIWHAYERRLLDNQVRTMAGFEHTSHDDRVQWADAGRRIELDSPGDIPLEPGESWLFVVRGALTIDGETHPAPDLVSLLPGSTVSSTQAARLLLLPQRPR